MKLLWDLTPPRERPFVKPNLGDANFIMEQCNDNGNVAYLSRDELKDAVLLWRRIEEVDAAVADGPVADGPAARRVLP